MLYNATAIAWDPYKNEVIHTFQAPGLSGDPLLHASGVRVDALDRLSLIIDAGASFDSNGENIQGDNLLVKYDLRDNSLLWQANLTNVTGGVYSGYQDSESDEAGNTFALGTFPSSLIKVSADGKSATPWYLLEPANHTVRGFTAIVRKGSFFVVSDSSDGQLYRFDARASKGTPIHIPISNTDGSEAKSLGSLLDGMNMPSLYAGTVILLSENKNGTIVLRSSDGSWESAKNLGVIPNPFFSDGGYSVASVQIADSIYAVPEFFGDAIGGKSGNRTKFPLWDITREINRLLEA